MKKHLFLLTSLGMALLIPFIGRLSLPESLNRWGWLDAISIALGTFAILCLLNLSGKKVGGLLSGLFILFLLVVGMGNGWYYQFYRGFLSLSLFELLYETSYVQHSARSLVNIKPILLVALALPPMLWWLWNADRPHRTQLVGLAAGCLSLVGGLQVAHSYRPAKYFVAPSENAVMHLGREIMHKLWFSKTRRKTEGLQLRQAITQLLPYLHNHSSPLREYPLYAIPSKPTLPSQTTKRNMILVVLESVRASEMGLYGHKVSATPFLDRLAKRGLVAKSFYSNTTQTVRAEFSMLCGWLDYIGGAPYATRRQNRHFPGSCVPQILKRYGYKSHWFHSHNKRGFARHTFMPNIGFDVVHGKSDIHQWKKNAEKVGWGYSDKVLFDYTLDKLEQEKKPFFAEVLTLSNHYPFTWNWKVPMPPEIAKARGGLLANYRRGIYYTDHAVSTFWKRFSQSKLAKNTIVAFVGDHGIWTFDLPQEKHLRDFARHERYYRVPFLAVGPGIKAQVIDTPLSQIDIAPTILSWLNIKAPTAYVGRAFAGKHKVKGTHPVFTLHEEIYGYRQGDLRCIPTKQTCFHNMFPRCGHKKKPKYGRVCIRTNVDLLTTNINEKNSKVVSKRILHLADALVSYTQRTLRKEAFLPPKRTKRKNNTR